MSCIDMYFPAVCFGRVLCSAALQRSVIMAIRQNQTSKVGFIKQNKSSEAQSDTEEVYDNASLITVESESST